MKKERLAVLDMETSTDELVKLWFEAEVLQHRDWDDWNRSVGIDKTWRRDHFEYYRYFAMLAETGGDALGRFGNRIGDLMRDKNRNYHTDYIRFYLLTCREVMRKNKPSNQQYIDAWQVEIEMKYLWLEIIEGIHDPFVKMSHVSTFIYDFNPANARSMFREQAKGVVNKLPEYRLVATAYPCPRVVSVPDGVSGKREIVANKQAVVHWREMAMLANHAKERNEIDIYNLVDRYLLGALGSIDLEQVDGWVVECLLEYCGESEKLTADEKKLLVGRCLDVFRERDGSHGIEAIVSASVNVYLAVGDLEGAIDIWKKYAEYSDKGGVLTRLMEHGIKSGQIERLRQERKWFVRNAVVMGMDREMASRAWRLRWCIAVVNLYESGNGFYLDCRETMLDIKSGFTHNVDRYAGIARVNSDREKFNRVLRERLKREIEAVKSWEKKDGWETFPYMKLEDCIETILQLRGELH